MSCEITIRGIPVNFPFEPYEIQKSYMEKVIECLQNETNGVLESPTGTGKTLSLLCSSLAWLTVKKAQVQAQRQTSIFNDDFSQQNPLLHKLNQIGGNSNGNNPLFGVPTIIYSSRTHSQLSQAMQELKRTAYSYMVATVLGSRDQMCIHPDVMNEPQSWMKVNLCKMKTQTRSCQFYNRVERKKDDMSIYNTTVIDIEDLVEVGKKHKCCPYFLSKELKQQTDMVFMPYNYLIDPRARKALGVELKGNVIILDEAHNIERICEEAASFQIKSTDISLAIEEVTAVMKALSEESVSFTNNETPKDFTPEELCILKEMLLEFEKSLDSQELKNDPAGTTFSGEHVFEILGKAGIKDENANPIQNLLEKLIQFLATVKEGVFQRKGNGLQVISDFLRIVFVGASNEFKNKVKKCYKVHINVVDEQKNKKTDNWLTKVNMNSKSKCKVLSYWCFSPGFGMNSLMDQGVKCVILTSGTLAPLAPLISELELKVDVKLENPHIITKNQIFIRVINKGPDMEMLTCTYQNRDNPKFIDSLGRSIINLVRIIPDGMLIFFPSYPIMQKCQQYWQESGCWGSITQYKPIFVEPKTKDAFNSAMTEYYAKIQDINFKGAIFMGVCRGKVSEGLDFADVNGRAVVIVGLPYPPLKDPRVILKKQYLDICNAKDKEFLTGNDWYSLEAIRAVNQAVGRVIRHKDDYGAIILMDSRFTNSRVTSQMSLWLKNNIKLINSFGELMRDLKQFFSNAQENFFPKDCKSGKTLNDVAKSKAAIDEGTSQTCSTSSGMVNIHKRLREVTENLSTKKKKLCIVPNAPKNKSKEIDTNKFVDLVKNILETQVYHEFISAVRTYRDNSILSELLENLNLVHKKSNADFKPILDGLLHYIKDNHKQEFLNYCGNFTSA